MDQFINTTLFPLFPCLFLVVTLLLWLLYLRKSSDIRKKQPPGPPGWPIVGNIFDLGAIPYQTMYNLKPIYGPLLWLRLGSLNTLVVQSADAAEELFKVHDSSFCDRKVHEAFTSHDYCKGSIAVGRYGDYWRMLRRLCTVELMSNKRILDTASVRMRCIHKTIRYIEDVVTAAKAKGELGEVDLSYFLFLMGFNTIGNLTLSRDVWDLEGKQGNEFYEAMDKFMVWAGKPNVADFLPFLKLLDPQRIKKNVERDMGRTIEIVTSFVKERVKEKKLGKVKEKDFLDVLLEYEHLSYDQIVIIILEIFFGGTETTSTTMEWVMTELLRNPKTIKKVQEELEQVVGQNRKVEESDIEKLTYLKAVVKESLRLHPPLPLLVPRNTLRDTKFMGYLIPKDTLVLVNAWAIGRDPNYWEDPLSFKPERFLGSTIDYKGQNFELIPFGAGRRICVGLSLAHNMVHIGLASLLHHFDWELGKNIIPETVDMNERLGITARKLIPLKVLPRKRFTIS